MSYACCVYCALCVFVCVRDFGGGGCGGLVWVRARVCACLPFGLFASLTHTHAHNRRCDCLEQILSTSDARKGANLSSPTSHVARGEEPCQYFHRMLVHTSSKVFRRSFRERLFVKKIMMLNAKLQQLPNQLHRRQHAFGSLGRAPRLTVRSENGILWHEHVDKPHLDVTGHMQDSY